jgi:putative ABC transport system permease protein
VTLSFGPGLVAALLLVVLTIVLSRWLELGIAREIMIAISRATLQLLAVGLVFLYIFDSAFATAWAWAWVVFMVVNASRVVRKRAQFEIPFLASSAAFAIGVSAALSILVIFVFGVLEFAPVSLVVIAGITIGNAVPATVLAAKQSVALCRDRRPELEAVLSLGFDRGQVVRFMAPRAAKMAITPQVERTKVVGLIALPGAMTGLLLAGVDPLEAVTIQLLIMFLVLATVAVSVMSVSTTVIRGAVTQDVRAAQWTEISSPT